MKDIKTIKKEKELAALQKAIDWAGSKANLAELLECNQSSVTHMLKVGRMSKAMAEKFEQVSNGFMKATELKIPIVQVLG